MSLPQGFVYLRDVAPAIVEDVVYFGPHNFLGRPVAGYHAPVCILTEQAAHAAARVQRALEARGLGLKVFDAYRPQQAVDDFIVWSTDPNVDETGTKSAFYPHVNRADLFAEGYLAAKSSHSRGSTMDLTLIDQDTGQSLDFGTPFDFFDPLTHTDHLDIGGQARDNRTMLMEVMGTAGFVNYPTEWWHFTLDGEPFPGTYFDFPVG